jgi:hypothetical protein
MLGAAGCIPGNALAFLTLYLQLLGMSDLAASCVTVAFLVGQAFGATMPRPVSCCAIETVLCCLHHAHADLLLPSWPGGLLTVRVVPGRRKHLCKDTSGFCMTSGHTFGMCPAGGVIGGAVGDWAAQRYPAHGRVALCQLSVASGIPFCLLIFRVCSYSSAHSASAGHCVRCTVMRCACAG